MEKKDIWTSVYVANEDIKDFSAFENQWDSSVVVEISNPHQINEGPTSLKPIEEFFKRI